MNKPVANNSVVLLKTTQCLYCKLSFHCYSNSSQTGVGYIIFPNSRQYYRSSRAYYGVEVYRRNPSGISFKNSALQAPRYEGIYTCRLPDSNGNILDINIAYYRRCSSKYNTLILNIIIIIIYTFYFFHPNFLLISGKPDIYYSKFTFQSTKGEKSYGTLEIRTRYSPPTKVTWQRDGVIVHAHPHMEGDGYEMTQILTNRRSSYYTTYLRIRNIPHLVGSHIYTCIVENNCGSTSKNISTHVQGILLILLLSHFRDSIIIFIFLIYTCKYLT